MAPQYLTSASDVWECQTSIQGAKASSCPRSFLPEFCRNILRSRVPIRRISLRGNRVPQLHSRESKRSDPVYSRVNPLELCLIDIPDEIVHCFHFETLAFVTRFQSNPAQRQEEKYRVVAEPFAFPLAGRARQSGRVIVSISPLFCRGIT